MSKPVRRVLEKDELMRRVWPDAIVEEVGVAKNISAMREARADALPRAAGLE